MSLPKMGEEDIPVHGWVAAVGDWLHIRRRTALLNVIKIKEVQIFTSEKGVVTDMERERMRSCGVGFEFEVSAYMHGF